MQHNPPFLMCKLAFLGLSISLLLLSGCGMVVKTFKPAPPPASWIEPLPSAQAHDGKMSELKNRFAAFLTSISRNVVLFNVANASSTSRTALRTTLS